jgi:glycine dehydrogenase
LNQQNEYYFDTLKININAHAVRMEAEKNEINFQYIDKETVAIAINETTDEVALLKILNVFEAVVHQKNINGKVKIENHRYPLDQKRRSPYLTHQIFNSFHSETAMMRYIKSLERKDLSLNHSMISLGSCTMKLNAAAEMLPLSWPRWSGYPSFCSQRTGQGISQNASSFGESTQ